jgi:hypothetical protein
LESSQDSKSFYGKDINEKESSMKQMMRVVLGLVTIGGGSLFATDALEGFVRTDIKGTITSNGGTRMQGHREGPEKAFDGNSRTKYCINTPTIWMQVALSKESIKTFSHYAITTANDVPKRDPQDWQLLGSNDGQTWSEVDARTGEQFEKRFQTRLFEIKSPGKYGFYKLVVSRNHGEGFTQLADLDFLTKEK